MMTRSLMLSKCALYDGKSLLPRINQSKSAFTMFAENSRHHNSHGALYDCVVTSLYRFVALSPERVDQLVDLCNKTLSLYPEITGTLLVATEGVNGQFALPLDRVEDFKVVLDELDEEVFGPISLNVGLPFSSSELQKGTFPFKKLQIKKKREVLTAKLYDEIDWTDAGPEVSASEWHKEVENLLQKQSEKDPKAPLLLG